PSAVFGSGAQVQSRPDISTGLAHRLLSDAVLDRLQGEERVGGGVDFFGQRRKLGIGFGTQKRRASIENRGIADLLDKTLMKGLDALLAFAILKLGPKRFCAEARVFLLGLQPLAIQFVDELLLAAKYLELVFAHVEKGFGQGELVETFTELEHES